MERSLGHRAPLLWLLCPWMLGLALGRWLPPGVPLVAWGGAALAGVAFAAWGFRRDGAFGEWLWRGGLVLALTAAGLGYLQQREHRLVVWDRLPPREAELVLRIERMFPATPGRESSGGLARIVGAPALLAELRGQLVFFSVRGGDRAWLARSAEVRAEGVIAALPRRPGAGFDAYLASCGAAFKFTRGRLLAPVAPPQAFFRFCDAAAANFERSLTLGLDDQPRLRSVLVAMLLGRKAELSDEQQTVFMQSGTMHLFAISGLHVAVIWTALAAGLAALRLPRAAAVLGGLVALFLYVQITGGAPSALRSFIMIAFVMLGRALRWPNNAVASIGAAALFTLVLDPFQLFGAGFQMSYSVVAALLWFGLPLDERWQKRWQPWRELPEAGWTPWQRAVRFVGRGTLSALALCLAATAINAPTSIELFGLFTPGALLANLLLIPLGSFVLYAGLASLLVGLCGADALCVLFNHAGIVVIWLMERLAETGVQLPAMFWAAEWRWAWGGPLALVLLLAAVAAGYAHGWGKRTGGLWMPVALLAVFLALGVRWGAPGPRGAATAASRSLPAAPAGVNAPGP